MIAIQPVNQETQSAAATRRVFLGLPGPNWMWGAVKGIVTCSSAPENDVKLFNNGLAWDDINKVWIEALNSYEAGYATHFAMLHADISPEAGWLDTMLDELDASGASLLSAVVPIKDRRGLTSCGIGDVANSWRPFRRFTMREIMELPETFGIRDTPHADRFLLHNSGLWVCDLSDPKFREVDEAGNLKAIFAFPIRARRGADGKWIHERESEDWYFSRQIAALEIKTAITRKVTLGHTGGMEFMNDKAWGLYRDGDEDTAANWRPQQ